MKLPQHVAIIMDGNGRWAEMRGHSRVFGHVRGAKAAKNTIEACARWGVKNLTLFTFSTENWQRPQGEVSFLMRLLRKHLQRERQMLRDQNIRFCCIGDLLRLPDFVQHEVVRTINETQENSGMTLTFALSYGGRQEIVNTARVLAQKVQEGKIKPESINEELFSATLESAFLPDPDLIIRTSGETRISNFFLWQAAYSEIYFTNVLWPDFTSNDLAAAFEFYSSRQRRFGKIISQKNPETLNV